MRFKHTLLVLLALCFCSVLMTTAASARVLLSGLYHDTADTDIWVKTLGGRVAVQRTWYEGSWSFNRSWNPLVLQHDAAKVISIDRNGDIYKPAAGQEGLFLYGATRSIRETASGFRWQNRKGDWIEYDSLGRISAYGDERNVRVTMGYDVIGRITGVFDHFGRQMLWFTYDAVGKLIGVRDAQGVAGRHVSYSYTGDLLTGFTDLRGNSWIYSYQTGGRYPQLASKTDPLGRVTTITYDAKNRVESVMDQGQCRDQLRL